VSRRLGRDIESLRTSLRANPNAARAFARRGVFHKAVHDALAYDEFYNVKQVATARDLLKQGAERAKALRADKRRGSARPARSLRAYRSRVDGSVQPFGVVVPASWKAGDKTPRPLWLLDARTR